MCQMVHVAVGGSSGWGKSTFLRALAYQLALSAEPVDLVMVDLEGATLAPFAECGRLLWPVADTERDALAVFSELMGEMDRRKALYAGHPGVDSLQAYNAEADEALTPVVCLTDEATALLADKGVESALRTLTLRARKYGLWLILGGQDWKASSLDTAILGGQDWKASSLDTAIRNQLSTTVHFRARSAAQSRVLLGQSGAENLEAKGRCLAWLPGREMVELQAPHISHQDIMAAVKDGGPKYDMPKLDDWGDDTARRILALAREGLSKNRIQMEVFGYTGGRAYSEVTRVLGDTTTTGDGGDGTDTEFGAIL